MLQYSVLIPSGSTFIGLISAAVVVAATTPIVPISKVEVLPVANLGLMLDVPLTGVTVDEASSFADFFPVAVALLV